MSDDNIIASNESFMKLPPRFRFPQTEEEAMLLYRIGFIAGKIHSHDRSVTNADMMLESLKKCFKGRFKRG